MTAAMATPPKTPDLNQIDTAIRSLTDWLIAERIPCTRAQFQALDAETFERINALPHHELRRAGAVIVTISELESFLGRFDLGRGLWWEFVDRLGPDRFDELRWHDWLSNEEAEKVRKHLCSLDSVAEILEPIEEIRLDQDIATHIPSGLAAKVEASAQRITEDTLAALRPLILATARRIPWSRGFRRLQAVATEPGALDYPATSLARVARHLIALTIDVLLAPGQISEHAAEIPSGERGWTALLTTATNRLHTVGFDKKQIAKMLPDGLDTGDPVKRVSNRLTAARERGLSLRS
jgi:hypothetical protein